MSNVIPTLTLSNGVGLKVLGIDGGKAPALDQTLSAAPSPEAATYAVQTAIECSVSLFVAGGNRPDTPEPFWTIVNPQHVVSVNCHTFD
jgi:hypothetical protein